MEEQDQPALLPDWIERSQRTARLRYRMRVAKPAIAVGGTGAGRHTGMDILVQPAQSGALVCRKPVVRRVIFVQRRTLVDAGLRPQSQWVHSRGGATTGRQGRLVTSPGALYPLRSASGRRQGVCRWTLPGIGHRCRHGRTVVVGGNARPNGPRHDHRQQ